MFIKAFCLFFLIAIAHQDQFTCPGAGRYMNPDASKCDTYFICTPDTAGTIIPFYVECMGDQAVGGYCTGGTSTCNTPSLATFDRSQLTCNGGRNAIPGNSKGLYQCTSNFLYFAFCPEGWLWVNGLTCRVDPNYVPFDPNSNPSLLPTSVALTTAVAGSVCDDGPGLYANPDPTKCNTFISCVGGITAYEMKCAADLVWRQNQQTCDYPTAADCLPPATICLSGPGPVFANPYDCSTYFLCNQEGDPYLMPCATGLIFDSTYHFCGFNWQATCASNGFCAANPHGYYVTSYTAYHVTCTSAMLNQKVHNFFDSTWVSFAVCTAQGPKLAYCCGHKSYNAATDKCA